MSKNTQTEAPKQKSNVGYRLLAALFFLASVAVLFLPINAYTQAWALEVKTLTELFKVLFASEEKLFGVLPALIANTGIVSISATLAIYLFALCLLLTIIISFASIVSRKSAPRRTRLAIFFFTWGCAGYALSILCISSFVNTIKTTYDLYTTALAIVGAVFYFILMIVKLGKAAWLSAVHFLLSLGVSALLIFAMTYDGAATAVAFAANPLYKWILVGVIAFAMLNLFVATIRAMSAKGLGLDMARYILQLLASLLACYVSYAGAMDGDLYLVLVVGAAVVSAMQIIIANLQLDKRAKKNTEDAKEEVLSGFETERYVEAYEYEGGPVAGVEVAEEVNPTMAAASGMQPNISSLVGNGFDPFMITLNAEEKAEFIDLYILRCKGPMPEIPTYDVGAANKEFFNAVFIYLGQYREKISSGLLQKMFEHSMKL